MPLTYDHESRLKMLSPVLDEHAEWYSRVIRQIFYPEHKMKTDLLQPPESFDVWIRESAKDENIDAKILQGIQHLHKEMMQSARDLLKEAIGAQEKPDARQFDAFVILFDEFISHLRRLERDVALEDSGIDLLTGLRTRQMMAKDLEREMERRARRGRPFCLALAKVDHYEQLKAAPQEVHDKAMRDLSEIIKLCIRSFDDAYRLSDGEFLMCLKQTEMSGGSAGLTRLRKLMEERDPLYIHDGKEVRLSLSSCVAEPQPGDTMDDMIANMRKDLERYGGENETLLEYVELSPLQRFVTGLGDDAQKKTI